MARTSFPCPETGELCTKPECSRIHCATAPIAEQLREKAAKGLRQRVLLKKPTSEVTLDDLDD